LHHCTKVLILRLLIAIKAKIMPEINEQLRAK
jgi:hypothetical protein